MLHLSKLTSLVIIIASIGLLSVSADSDDAQTIGSTVTLDCM